MLMGVSDMTFYTVSFGYGVKREGKRLSHLIVHHFPPRTVCGLKVSNPGAVWAFSDANFILSIDLMKGSTIDSQQAAIGCHITCRSCLRAYKGN